MTGLIMVMLTVFFRCGEMVLVSSLGSWSYSKGSVELKDKIMSL